MEQFVRATTGTGQVMGAKNGGSLEMLRLGGARNNHT